MFKVFSVIYLAIISGITESEFHREIKPVILRDFKQELEEKNIKNPDIGLDKNNDIYLVDPLNAGNYISTGVNIVDYI